MVKNLRKLKAYFRSPLLLEIFRRSDIQSRLSVIAFRNAHSTEYPITELVASCYSNFAKTDMQIYTGDLYKLIKSIFPKKSGFMV